VTDDYPLECANTGSGRPPQTRAESQKERSITDVTHGNTSEGDVLDRTAINAFEREATATLEDAVADRDIFEATVRFGATLDPSRWLRGIGIDRFKRTVQHRTYRVAAYIAVADRDVLRRACFAKRERTLQADSIVPRRVYAAPGDPHILATINVHSIAICVDLQIFKRQVVDAGRQDAKMPSGKNRNVTHRDIAAALERDYLVGRTGSIGRRAARLGRLAPAQCAAADQA
jgi:hypothetical protein